MAYVKERLLFRLKAWTFFKSEYFLKSLFFILLVVLPRGALACFSKSLSL